MTSSAIEPPLAYDSRDCLLYLIMKLEPPAIMATIEKTVEDKISVSFQYLMKAIMKAVTKVATAESVSAIFSDSPSCTRLVSAVIRVVISPAPSLSK